MAKFGGVTTVVTGGDHDSRLLMPLIRRDARAARLSIPVAGAFAVRLAIARPAARAAAPAAAPAPAPACTAPVGHAAAAGRVTPMSAPCVGIGAHAPEEGGNQNRSQRSALHGLRVPSLPVYGLTLPLVLQLSSLVWFGLVAWLGAT